MDIIIKIAEQEDLPAIKKLTKDLVEVMDDKENIELNIVFENLVDIMNNKDSWILVAQADDMVVGFIHFTIRKTILHNAPSGLIDEIVVDKFYRNKGIGKKLVEAAIERCKKIGCCEVEVSTEVSNVNAKNFYRGLGFKERGVLFEMDL